MFNPIIFNNEFFLDINLPEIQPIYAVSNYGNVINKLTGKYLSMQLTEDGYLRIPLATIGDGPAKAFLVHRLVMMTHCPIPHPEMFEVNHINGIKIFNYVGNLEWCTGAENIAHAFRTGLMDDRYVLLTKDQVRFICECLSKGMTVREIIPLVGDTVCKDLGRNIRAIRERKAWKHISRDYTFSIRNDRDMFTDDEVHYICKQLENGYGYRDILLGLGIDVLSMDTKTRENYCDIISNIRMGRYYTDISRNYNLISVSKERFDQIFTINEINQICKDLENGLKAKEILAKFNIFKESNPSKYEQCRHLVSRIKNRKAFAGISQNYKF